MGIGLNNSSKGNGVSRNGVPIPDVDIIVPIHDGVEFLGGLLADLLTLDSKYSFNLWLADDASPDQRVPLMCRTAAHDPRVKYFRNGQNYQFAHTCNLAAARGKARYICFLNSDTKPIDDWLTPLVEVLESDPHVGMVAPMLLFGDDRHGAVKGLVQSVGFAFNARLLPWHRLITFSSDHPRVNYYRDDLQGVTGACFLTRRVLWSQIGGFWDSYVSTFEDVEYGIRIKEQGYKVACQPESRLYHYVGGSNAQDQLLSQRNAQLFLQRVGNLVRYDEHLVL